MANITLEYYRLVGSSGIKLTSKDTEGSALEDIRNLSTTGRLPDFTTEDGKYLIVINSPFSDEKYHFYLEIENGNKSHG